jgi:hypothetical protein
VVGRADSAGSQRIANLAGDLLIGTRFPIGNPQQCVPDLQLESSALEVNRHGKLPSAPGGIFPKFGYGSAGQLGPVLFPAAGANPLNLSSMQIMLAGTHFWQRA